MKMNSSGKVMTIFLVITAILLISLTAISLFFFQKESEQRKSAEIKLEKTISSEIKLQGEVDMLKKQNFLLEEKNKEADEKINSLLDELELEEGLREEMKKENSALKEQVDKAVKEKEKAVEELSKVVVDSKKMTAELETKLKAEIEAKTELEKQIQGAVKIQDMPEEIFAEGEDASVEKESAEGTPSAEGLIEEVELEKIVVVPKEIPEGRILSVDTETEFVIINIGDKDGLKVGNILSVYRGNDYLGDIKVTRLQSEMSAADFIPPFSSRRVRKNDQVIIKQ